MILKIALFEIVKTHACAPGETTLAVCARSWLSPLAGLSSFIVAMLALYFARRQFIIARQKQRLDILSERLEAISSLMQYLNKVHGCLYDLSKALELIVLLTERPGTDIALPMSDAKERWGALLNARDELRSFLNDSTIDDDLLEIAEDALANADLLRLPSTRGFVDAVANDERSSFNIACHKYKEQGQAETERLIGSIHQARLSLEREGRTIKSERRDILLGRHSN